MDEVTYSKRFSVLAGRPTGLISAASARRRHRCGEPYTVTLGTPQAPDAIIDVVWKNAHLGVWSLDAQQRMSVHFVFRTCGDHLFLWTVTRWTYPDGAVLLNQSTSIEEVRYAPDGVVRYEVVDHAAGHRVIRDLRDVDVGLNWEPIPEFGQWKSVARFDREHPPRSTPENGAGG